MALFSQTFTIMMVGMSLVFLFLFVVILCMDLIAFLVHRYEAKHAGLSVSDAGADAAAHRHLAAAIAVATELISEKN